MIVVIKITTITYHKLLQLSCIIVYDIFIFIVFETHKFIILRQKTALVLYIAGRRNVDGSEQYYELILMQEYKFKYRLKLSLFYIKFLL